MTLELALATEAVPTVNVETWKKALKAHPEFSPHYEAAKGKFLDESMQRLVAANDLKNLRWLLERRHWEMFGENATKGTNPTNHNGEVLSDEMIERARQIVAEDHQQKSKA